MGTISPWSSESERLSSKKKRVIEELVEGQEYANQLQILFHNPSNGSGHLSSSSSAAAAAARKLLVDKILRSFNHTLAVLSSSSCTSTVVDSPELAFNHDELKSRDSSESRKRSVSKDKRGCYKRKRAEQTRIIVSATMEDDHAWRKYGQKEILNSKQPRSYFRCTRKHDQGCRATKQVQRMEDGAKMYRITYIGTHTCINHAPQIIQGSESWETSTVDNGDSKTSIEQHHDQQSSPTPTIKQETKEETPTTTSDLTDLDSVMWKDYMGGDFGYYMEHVAMDSNVYPYTEISSRNFELDFMIKPLEFENEFEFDDSDEGLL